MSRYLEEYDGDDDDVYFRWGAWQANYRKALKGCKGRKALRELREALLALPDKRLITHALCTVNPERRKAELDDEVDRENLDRTIARDGAGVCLIGAYLWHQKVKAGMDPAEAFDALPNVGVSVDIPGPEAMEETAVLATRYGMTYTLAFELARQNDNEYDRYTPEQRYTAFLAWIDAELAEAA